MRCWTATRPRGFGLGTDKNGIAYTTYASRFVEPARLTGAVVALIVVAMHGRPTHVAIIAAAMALLTSLGVTLGYHRLFAHRSFSTFRAVERVLMILGCMAACAPFYWVAVHRTHHRHSDQDGDPHSPHTWAGRRFGRLRGMWHSYFDWVGRYGNGYKVSQVRDLTRRPDFVWIDRHWFLWYILGLALPALIAFLIGGTAFDALIGFLWGGVFRHFLVFQVPFVVNTVCHLWGSQPYETADHSRNNFVVGVVALGEGWHNNHHAYPSSARHGFHWWQIDITWYVICLLERVGLAWDVKQPSLALRQEILPEHTAS
jgi:stearoyl-CoA desaturase (delta-9 desaturase)